MIKFIKLLLEANKETFEEFAKKRGEGAAKIASNAEEKGGLSLLTWHHFKVKAPYYKKATEGKFDKEAAEKECRVLCRLAEGLPQVVRSGGQRPHFRGFGV